MVLETSGVLPDIVSFQIKDNGIGFNDDNMNSFMEADSSYKEESGGKGVGRFSWLVAFQSAHVESVFYQRGQFFKREFTFSVNHDEIEDRAFHTDARECCTSVELKDIKTPFDRSLPKNAKTIANRILQHCLIYFLAKDCPKVELIDEQERIDLNDLCREKILIDSNIEKFTIGGYDFELLHVKAEESGVGGNKLFLCANDRLVETRNLDKYVTNLDKSIYEKNGFWYIGILSGKYFNENVDMNRLSFSIPEGGLAKDLPLLSMDEIIEMASELVEQYLAEYLEPIAKEKETMIRRFVTNVAPQFRHLLKYKQDAIRKIKPNFSEDKLADELYQIKYNFDRELTEESTALLHKLNYGHITDHEYREGFQKQVQKISDSNAAVLAEYVAHRKLILDLLENAIRKKMALGDYQNEKYIHDLIYPMRSDSSEQLYENHNLWLLDEKLAYATYISSDIPFNNDREEEWPDILILDGPVAMSENSNDGSVFNSIFIFELKKPMRKDYSDGDNPISQLYRYADKIKSGKAMDKDGRLIRVSETTQFYLYALCDINEKLISILNHYGIFHPTPDRMGYFGYHQGYNAHIEILSYDKMLSDSKKRNKVLFDKLGF